MYSKKKIKNSEIPERTRRPYVFLPIYIGKCTKLKKIFSKTKQLELQADRQ